MTSPRMLRELSRAPTRPLTRADIIAADCLTLAPAPESSNPFAPRAGRNWQAPAPARRPASILRRMLRSITR